MQIYGSRTILLLEKALDARALEQRTIANNMANINTPGFKKSSVKFESILKEKMSGGKIPLATCSSRHFGAEVVLSGVNPVVEREEGTSMRADGNNVDVEQEMVKLAANTISYNAEIQELNNRLSLLGYVINGR